MTTKSMKTNRTFVSPQASNQTMESSNVNMSRVGKKNVGLRAFYPIMPCSMSNLEKAKIWVKRHNNNYFIGWTHEQLMNLDPLVRPLTIITPELYKHHMNRSEYCRIVRLKYCLESDAEWAIEFRRRLSISSSNGGFKSLGEAKICATEMWRKYSEEYDASRARTSNVNARSNTNFISPNCKKMKLMLDGSDEANYALPSSSSMKVEQTDDALTNHGFSTFWNMVSTNLLSTTPSNDNCSEDNSIDEPSTGVEGEKYEMMNLFPCVENMNISHAEKMNILVQRKDNNFFLDVPESLLIRENPRTRPFKPINRQDYQAYVFSEEGQIASAATMVHNINKPWSTKLQCMLELPSDQGFSTWVDAKQELLVQLQKFLSQKEQCSGDIQDVCVDGNRPVSINADDDVIYCSDEDIHEDLRTQAAKHLSKCSVQAFPVSSIDDNHTSNLQGHLSQSSHISHTSPVHDETIYSTNTRNASCPSSHIDTDDLSNMNNFQIKQETPTVRGIKSVHSMHNSGTTCNKKLGMGANSVMISSTSLDTPKNNSTASMQRPTSTSVHLSQTQAPTLTGLASYPVSIPKNQSSGPSKQSHIDGVSKDVIKKLWDLRKQLSYCCHDDPSVSWHDKLRPHLPLIRSQLGETYTLPTSVSECMADLVLVLLHEQLTQK